MKYQNTKRKRKAMYRKANLNQNTNISIKNVYFNMITIFHIQTKLQNIHHFAAIVLFVEKIGDRFSEDKSIVKDYIREIDSPIKNHRCYSHISDEELYEKYHDKMPIFFVEDIFKEKYVTIDRNNRK